LVSSGVVDFGITGKNMIIETGKNTSVATELNFARCSVIIATPKNSSIKSLNDLQNKIIATSYPNTLKNYLNKVGIKSNIIIMNGSVEIAPKLGLADAICDITETGSSLKKNDLEIIETIFKSEACLIESKSFNPKKEILLNILTSKYENISI
jgi:ATP phosphoribosyltransferase